MIKDAEKIVNNVPGGLVIYRVGETIETVSFSDGIPKMQGYTREEYMKAVSHNATDIVFKPDLPVLSKSIELAIKNNDSLNISYRVYCKNRDTIWVNLSASPAGKDEDGCLIYYAVFTNSTSQFNLYQDICDNATSGAIVFDKETGEIYYANRAFFAIMGRKMKNYVGLFAQKLFGSEITDKEKKLLLQPSSDFIHKMNGSKKIAHVCSRETEWLKRRSILVYAADVTSEYQKQEELETRYDNQVNFSRMLSKSSIASSMVNLTKNCITLQNTENDEIMTVITKETPQEGFESMYGQIPDKEIRKEYEKIFNRKTIIRDFKKGITHKSIRHPYERLDNWIKSSYDAVRNPKTGDLEVYCFAKDITQEVIGKDLTDALMMHDYESVYLINPETGKAQPLVKGGYERVFAEVEKAGNIIKGFENFFAKYSAGDDAASLAKAADIKTVTIALKTQKFYTLSYSVYDDNHNIIRKRASYSYLNKYKSHVLCTVQDITADFENELEKRQRLENALNEAHRAMKAKTLFLSNMSHDMRTPMNAILGLSGLAADLKNSDELKDYMQKINASGKQLLSLIDDTLDVSRIENGKLTMNREYVMSRRLLTDGIASTKVVAAQKGVNFLLCDNGLEDRLMFVDAVKVIKIFTNLLSNAVKFTPPRGTVTFTIDKLEEIGVDVTYKLTVKDTGIGMSKEFLTHIYEPFSQERTDYSTNATGTGLGMTIVKELTQFLGGKVEIKSELSRGTEAIVTLPFKLAEEGPLVRKQEIFTPVSGSHKILVAEDHPLNAKIVEKLLLKFGYEVQLTCNGEKCVEAFKSSANGDYAAILMDIRMPVMDGITAAKNIRALSNNDAKVIPIIAMTANAFEQDVKDCLDAGMNLHLSKPLEPEKLYTALKSMIKSC